MTIKNNKIKGELQRGEYPCPKCPSSNAMKVYKKNKPDGSVYFNAHCYSCDAHISDPPGWNDPQELTSSEQNDSTWKVPSGSVFKMNRSSGVGSAFAGETSKPTKEELLNEFELYPFRDLPDRGITRKTCERFGVRVSVSPIDGQTIITHMYPYYKRGKLSGYKERIVEGKKMFSKGDCQGASLFGSNCFNPGGRILYITEGELDAMSLWQTLTTLSDLDNYDPCVVSLSHGAASAAKDISADIDFVNSFEKVVLVFDQDDAGELATEDACKILSGKAYIAKLSEKDANDMIMAGKANDLKWAVLKHAQLYTPDSIVHYSDCWEEFVEGNNQTSYPWPESWVELNKKTYGLRLGEITTVTSGSGSGKTQWLREMKYHFYNTTNWKMAEIALEETVSDSIGGLLSLHLNKRITLPDVRDTVPLEEQRAAFDYMFASNRWDGYKHFGGMDDDNLYSKIRWYAANGHKVLWLDHLSIIVSEYAAEGNERERIDTIMTKLAKLVKELNIAIVLVVHLKKADGHTSFEEGAVPSLDDLRGSGSLKQLSWTVLAISRNQQHPDPICANTSETIVLKCRLTGRTGVADYLYFQENTGRMVKVPKPNNYRPDKKKGGFAVNEF